jgi:hypothetical protein
MAIATAALLAGCGGSSSKSSTAPTAPSSGQIVTAKEGGFSTIVPHGYRYVSTPAQYVVEGAEAGGLSEQIAVLRQRASEGDLATVARATLRVLKRPPNPAQEVSALRSLVVDGEPAAAVDYLVSLAVGKAQHNTIVLVGHGRWVYSIRASSSPEQSTSLNHAIEEVIHSWRWL